MNDTSLNVALFVPLGSALGVLANRRAVLLIPLAAALPLVIEAIQLWAGGLGRGCQSADVADNLLGLGLGLSIGLAWTLAARGLSRARGT